MALDRLVEDREDPPSALLLLSGHLSLGQLLKEAAARGPYREDAVRASDIHPTAVVDSIADIPALLRPDSADTAR